MQRSIETVVHGDQSGDQSVDPLAVLSELFELLQDYAPTWYTEDLHGRTAAALGKFEPAFS